MGSRCAAFLPDLLARFVVGPDLLALFEILVGEARDDGSELGGRRFGVAGADRKFVIALEQTPIVLALAGLPLHAHEVPVAFKPLAVQRKDELSLLDALARIAIGHPGAAVPHDHGAAAIFALGDDTFPGEIVELMIL